LVYLKQIKGWYVKVFLPKKELNYLYFTQSELNEAPLLSWVEAGMKVIGLNHSDKAGETGVITFILEGEDRNHPEGAVLDINVQFEDEQLFVCETQVVFLIKGAYRTIEGKLYCPECREVKDSVAQVLEEDTNWTWNETEYEVDIVERSEKNTFEDCAHTIDVKELDLMPEMRYLYRPLTVTQICKEVNEAGFLEKTIQVNLDILASGKHQNMSEYLSSRIVGTQEMKSISYFIKGLVPNRHNLVFVQVLGDVSHIVTEYRETVMDVRFVSVWDDSHVIETHAAYNKKTGQIFEIQHAEPIDQFGFKLQTLDEQYVLFPDGEKRAIIELNDGYFLR